MAAEWAALPKTADVISSSLRALQSRVREEHFSRDRLTSLHATEVRCTKTSSSFEGAV